MYCTIVVLRHSQLTDVVTLIRTQNNLLKVPAPVLVVDKPKRIPVLLGCCATSVGNWFPSVQGKYSGLKISTSNSCVSRQLGDLKISTTNFLCFKTTQ